MIKKEEEDEEEVEEGDEGDEVEKEEINCFIKIHNKIPVIY
jgi:hypothetical protein